MAHRLGYLTTLQPRSVVKLFGGVDYCTQCTVLVRTETIEKGLEQRLARYRPILYVHVYILGYILKGGRVMIAFFVNYSTVAFPLHLPPLKRQQFFGAVANSLRKISYFPLPLDVRRCVAPTGEEVDARQRGVN